MTEAVKMIMDWIAMCRFPVENAEVVEVKPVTDDLKDIWNLVLPKACYNNSYHYASFHNAKYVIGYGMAAGLIPVEHVWIEVDGVHYDPTWEKHIDDADGTYVKLFEFTPSELMDAIEVNDMTPPSLFDIMSKELK